MEIKSLTSLRGIAAIWVMIMHFSLTLLGNVKIPLLSHGFLGVDLFFILSSFVLALNYSDKFLDFKASNWFNFMQKRFRRIYPLYFFFVILFLLFKNDFKELALIKIIPNVLLMQNFFSPNHTYLSVTWSLSVEWIAYLIFPILIIINNRFKSHLYNFVLVLISLMLRFYSGNYESQFIGHYITKSDFINLPYDNTYGSSSIFRMLSAYIIGLVAYNYRNIKISPYLVLSLIISTFFINQLLLMIPILFSLLIISLLKENIFTKILSWKPLYYFGLISYSVYLSHYFLLIFINVNSISHFILISILTVIMSYATYQIIEKRKYITFWK